MIQNLLLLHTAHIDGISTLPGVTSATSFALHPTLRNSFRLIVTMLPFSLLALIYMPSRFTWALSSKAFSIPNIVQAFYTNHYLHCPDPINLRNTSAPFWALNITNSTTNRWALNSSSDLLRDIPHFSNDTTILPSLNENSPLNVNVEQCSSSWSSWVAASTTWEIQQSARTLYTWETGTYYQTVGVGSTYVACDGITHMAANFSATGVVATIVTTAVEWKGKSIPFPTASPDCSIPESDCNRFQTEYYSSLSPTTALLANDDSSNPNLPQCMAVQCMGCIVYAERMALLHWPVPSTTRDFCGESSAAESSPPTTTPTIPLTITTTAITIHSTMVAMDDQIHELSDVSNEIGKVLQR